MAVATISVTLRPLRLAFIISPRSKSLFHAIQVNSLLWGGTFNPIIPAHLKMPRIWKSRVMTNKSAKEVIKGYIKAFDPDFFVITDEKIKDRIDSYGIPNEKIVEINEILDSVKNVSFPSYGIGFLEIVYYLYENELKFIRKEPIQILIPKFERKYELFLSSIFGNLPSDISSLIERELGDLLDIECPTVTLENYWKYLAWNQLFPRRIVTTGIRLLSHTNLCILLMDATNLYDVIDYWNLRACGWQVLPIAMQICRSDSAEHLLEKFIENIKKNFFSTSDIHVVVLKGRSVPMDIFERSVSFLRLKKLDQIPYIIQHEYPRIWDDWARKKEGINCCDLEVKTERYYFQAISERILLQTVDPDFKSKLGIGPRFANEIVVKTYRSGREPYAEVFPFVNSGDRDILLSLKIFDLPNWRISRKGLVYFPSFFDSKIEFSIPIAEDVMKLWLKSKKFSVELSSSGRIAKQMLKQLGGIAGISLLSWPGMIELLENRNDGDKYFSKEELWGRIQKLANKSRFPVDPKGLLKRLIDLEIFQLGLRIKCPVCHQKFWISLSDIDYKVKCPICLNHFEISSYTPDELKWSYRLSGTFGLPKQAYGAFSVLLTLRFFSMILQGYTTPIMSFYAKNGNTNIEIDLALFFQNSEFSQVGDVERKLLFVECKTFNNFKKDDIVKMKKTLKEFPEAVIVFSTLKKELSSEEKRLIKSYFKPAKNNNILILTATELFSDFPLENSYKREGGKYARVINNKFSFELRNLDVLCDITRQLYLV